QEGLLTFSHDSASWQWDVPLIRSRRITDNVADLMAARLGRLPADTRDLLGELACLGSIATARTIAMVRGAPEDRIQATLRGAVDAGLVQHVSESFAFTHDRVQEAAYAAIPESGRAAAHLRIGRA